MRYKYEELYEKYYPVERIEDVTQLFNNDKYIIALNNAKEFFQKEYTRTCVYTEKDDLLEKLTNEIVGINSNENIDYQKQVIRTNICLMCIAFERDMKKQRLQQKLFFLSFVIVLIIVIAIFQ